MSSVRHSNAERRRERDQCRERLSAHILDRLGIRTEPSEVRLIPREKDFYSWSILPDKPYLSRIFLKNLSDHSISTYRLLSREVGHTFEAIFSTAQGFEAESQATVCCVSLPVSPYVTLV
ncbi:hypothetical protein HRG_013743 [Hirsutella rhossiliensis]